MIFFSFVLSSLSKIEWNVSAEICFDFYGNFLPTKVQWPSISAHFYLIFYAINLRRKRNSQMQLRHATYFVSMLRGKSVTYTYGYFASLRHCNAMISLLCSLFCDSKIPRLPKKKWIHNSFFFVRDGLWFE